MKINDLNRAGMINPYRKQMIQSQPDQIGKQEKIRDNVQFSDEALKMLEATTDPERAAKVAKLKESVSKGTYHVEASKIAEKMLPFLIGWKK